MGLEKTTYKTSDTLTAEKMNDIQDAIIANEDAVTNLKSLVGDKPQIKKLSELYCQTATFEGVSFPIYWTGGFMNLTQSGYYVTDFNTIEGYEEQTELTEIVYASDIDGAAVYKISQPIKSGMVYYFKIESVPSYWANNINSYDEKNPYINGRIQVVEVGTENDVGVKYYDFIESICSSIIKLSINTTNAINNANSKHTELTGSINSLKSLVGGGIKGRSLHDTIGSGGHGETWYITTGFYYQDVSDHVDYEGWTALESVPYPKSGGMNPGRIILSQTMYAHKNYYVEVQSYPELVDYVYVQDGYALVYELKGSNLSEIVLNLFLDMVSMQTTLDEHTKEIAKINETLTEMDVEMDDIADDVANLSEAINDVDENIDTHYHRHNFSTKKWIAYGDSITDSDFSGTTKYVEVLGEYFKFASVSNYGLASSNIAHVEGEAVKCGVDIYEAHKTETADLITIFYGTNDWFNSVPVGTYTDTDTGTLFGAFNTIIKDIKTRQPNCEIIVITPIWRDWAGASEGGTLPYSTNGNGVTFEAFVDAIEKIANFHGVPCVNLYELLGVRQYSLSDKTPLHYTIDSLHPDQKGQYRIANVLKPLVEQRVLLSSNPNEVHEKVYNVGEKPLPTRIIDINDLVDTDRGQITSLDTANNQAVKPEGNNYIVVFKDTALNFIIQTSANSTLFFGLWANGNTGYGFAFNKLADYKGLCFTCDFNTGRTSTYTSFATNNDEWTDLNTGTNTLHFICDTEKGVWNIYEVANGDETLVASVSKNNFSAEDISATTPLFAVAFCYDARPFRLIK